MIPERNFTAEGGVIYMPNVIKVDPEWFPAENRNLQVGEAVFIEKADLLLQEGKVKLVEDEKKDKPEKPINKMNKKELLAKAKEMGIEVTEDMSNKEIVDKLTGEAEKSSTPENASPEGDEAPKS